MKLTVFNQIKKFLEIEKYVSNATATDRKKTIRWVAAIAGGAFLIMSAINIRVDSGIMLLSTLGAALIMLLGLIAGVFSKHDSLIKLAFYLVMLILFPIYTIFGGNDGFACLWMLLIPYLSMQCVDYKAGFVINVFYQIFLLTTFIGPFNNIIQYTGYNATFLMRYPALFFINFAFAVYIITSMRLYQYEVLMSKKKFEEMSTMDMSTGLRNRNGFIHDQDSFSSAEMKNLMTVFIDANGLHELNNTQGHAAGDKMLYTVAKESENIFNYATVYRMGGDEFLAVCTNVEEAKVKADAVRLSEKIEELGYSISWGSDYRESNFNLEESVKESNIRMRDYKANFYQTRGLDRRRNRANDN